MEIQSQFFDGRYYKAENFAQANRSLLKTGVNPDSESLKVIAHQNMTIKVQKGNGIIEGRTFQLDADQEITLAQADGSSGRTDTIIIRQNLTTGSEKFELLLITGALGAGATTPVRDGTFYDLVLAQISVKAGTTEITQSLIIDTRTNSELCGLMTTVATGIDITDFMAQQVAIFDEWQQRLAKDLTDNQAIDLQNQIYSKISKINGKTPSAPNYDVSLTLDDIPDGLLRRIAGMVGIQIQRGQVTLDLYGTCQVQFAKAFADEPIMMYQNYVDNYNTLYWVYKQKITPSNFSLSTYKVGGGNGSGVLKWIAIGTLAEGV